MCSFHVAKIFHIVTAAGIGHVFLTCKLLSLEQLLAHVDMKCLEMKMQSLGGARFLVMLMTNPSAQPPARCARLYPLRLACIPPPAQQGRTHH
jgi:hypothetical protein